MADAGTTAAVLGTLLAAHYVGDFWVQTDHQAQTKADKTAGGWASLVLHVATYTLTAAVMLSITTLVLGLGWSPARIALGLGVSAVTHGWADRRRPLAWLARVLGKSRFYDSGVQPVGTGAFQLDQAFHIFWLYVAALIIS